MIRSTTFEDCELLDVSGAPMAPTRTFILPFDRPRSPGRRRLRVASRARWAHEVSALLLQSFPYGGLQFCPPTIRLLPYQLEPAIAMLRYGALRVLIADDVGLGKTVEAGLLVREISRADRLSRILILCPAALRTQWAAELASLFDLHPVEAGTSWLQRATRDLPPDVNPWSLPGLYLASVDFVKRAEALRPLEDVRWDLLVVDEAHGATPGSDRGAAVHAIACRARRLILLTATPHSGSDEQAGALCSLGRGPASPPLVLFARTRQDTPLGSPPVRSSVLNVRLGPEERRMHRMLEQYTRRVWAERAGDAAAELVALVLRKRALSSPASLARSVRRRLELLAGVPLMPGQMQLPLHGDETIEEDEEPEAPLAARGLADPHEERAALNAIATVAEEASACEGKIRVLLRLLRRSREPAIVFSEYRDTAERIATALAAHGQDVQVLHGGLSPAERARVVAHFTAGASVLVSTDAASEGLNLHHRCRMVVHFELPWTPSRVHQRCGRVNRIGQTRRVHEIALVGNDTAEALVLIPLLRRAARSGRFSRAPLVEGLTESRIAAHVMGGVPLAPVAVQPLPGTAFLDVRREAEREAGRLELLRRLSAARSLRPAAPVPLGARIPVFRRRRSKPAAARSLLIVVCASLLDAHGLRLEHEVLAISGEIPNRPAASQKRSAFREEVHEVLARADPGLAAFLARWASARLAVLCPLQSTAVSALDRHVAGLERQMRSSARELVQAGLFDRRAMRATHALAQVQRALLDEARARGIRTGTDDDPGGRDQEQSERTAPIEARYEVRAVFLGPFP